MDNHIFRSAALGFNRQDVMEYIEKVQKDARTQRVGLTAQLDAALQESSASRQALEDCARERDQLRAELEELKERYETELSVQDAAKQQQGRLQNLETENSLLAGQVQELENRMGDLRKEKERLTQMELDARCRAEELLARTQVQADGILAKAAAQSKDIEDQAQIHADDVLAKASVRGAAIEAQAAAVLSEARQQAAALVEKCEDLLRSYEIMADHISSELRKMDVAVAQLPLELNQLKQGLAELIGQEEGTRKA